MFEIKLPLLLDIVKESVNKDLREGKKRGFVPIRDVPSKALEDVALALRATNLFKAGVARAHDGTPTGVWWALKGGKKGKDDKSKPEK